MDLEHLKRIVDRNCENVPNAHIYEPKDVEVVITLAEPSMGPRASCEVSSAFIGFDWESNQFRIEPKEKLVHYGLSRDDVKPAMLRKYENRNYYWCPSCDYRVGKEDRFCKTCGQKLREK